MVDQVRDMFGTECESLEQLAMLSQISQAEAKKFFIEQTRLKKWRRTGIIWWNMLDCWPQISDAVVDYYFHKKLAFYYIGRVQQPVCMVCAEPENWCCVGKVKTYSGVQRLIVMEWTLEDGRRGANHYVTGYPAFDARRYAVWLGIIEKLDTPFDSAGCFA